MAFDQLHAQAITEGNRARIRAAGMYGLLIRIREHNAARELDDDLLDCIDRAIADQERATASPTHDTHLLSTDGVAEPTPTERKAGATVRICPSTQRLCYEGCRAGPCAYAESSAGTRGVAVTSPAADPQRNNTEK
jgi:hypothetical protein